MTIGRFSVIAAFSLIATQGLAATYTFDVQVVDSRDLPDQGFVLPDLGTTGTVSFILDAATLDGDNDPNTGVNIDLPLDPMLASASASIGTVTAALELPTVFGFNERARFSNGEFSSLPVSIAGLNCNNLGCTFAGNFSVHGPAGSGTPTTFADVDAFLNNPLSTVSFSFNGTALGEFVSFRAESIPMSPVPLPATGLLLLGALGAGATIARRRKS